MQCDWTPTSLVCQQIDQSAQFFWYGAGSHNCAGDVFVFHDHPAICRLPHVQVYTQTTHEKKEGCHLQFLI